MYDHTSGAKNNNFSYREDNLFSYFTKPIKNTVPAKSITLKDVHSLIVSNFFAADTAKARRLKGKQYKVFKAKNFDYVTFNGLFSKREEIGLITPSYFFIIDMDGLGERLTLVFERLKNDVILSPLLIFISPSGDGLKIVVRIDFSVIDTKKSEKIMDIIWQAVNAYTGKNYADLINPNERNNFIDEAGKDLSRACFLCHDPGAYLNINEESILGQAFIDAYPSIEKKAKCIGSNKKDRSHKINPATTLRDLAQRHLLENNNHTPQLLSFIGGAKKIGTPLNHTLTFIQEQVKISPDSSKFDFENLRVFIEDLYNRYDTASEGVAYLTPLSFGYKFLYFKYSREIKQFVLSSLYWNEVRNLLHDAGFAKRKIGNKNFIYIQKKGWIITEVTPEIMRDYFTRYVVEQIQESVSFSFQGEQYIIPPEAIREVYLKNSNNIFNETWLEHLQVHDQPLLKDTEKEMYFFFKNDLVTVSKNEIKTENWNEKTGFCIWEDQIIKHDFSYIEDYSASHFYKFLQNVTNNDRDRMLTMCSGIGYLLHHYFRESEGQAVIFYDESITDIRTPMGGSGKGLIVNAITQVRKVTKVDGKHLAADNRFKWELLTPSTQVVWIDDIRPEFDFSILHSNQTDGWTIERKYLPQIFIDPKNSPKTVICANNIIKGGGTTNKRRQLIIELSDYYSRQIIRGDEKPIEQTHGGLFFGTPWTTCEWNMFFSLMFDCGHIYFADGLVVHSGINVEFNRFRQATDEDFAVWVKEQGFAPGSEYQTKQYYEPYVATYYGESHQFGQRKFTGYLKEYANYKGWSFKVIRRNGAAYFKF